MNLGDAIEWNDKGLCPAVAIDAKTGQFLMMAWMNPQAFEQTLATGFAHFYSRSRKTQWKKGESSGNTLAVEELRLDCDGDTIVLSVIPAGPACHTGKNSCAYRRAEDGEWLDDDGPAPLPVSVLDALRTVIESRKGADAGESYTKSLLDGGTPKQLAKLREELEELAVELETGSAERIVAESADLIFHWLVAVVGHDVDPTRVWNELSRRFGVSGHVEKASRKPA